MASVWGDQRRLKRDNIEAGPGRRDEPRYKAFQVEGLYMSKSTELRKLLTEPRKEKVQGSRSMPEGEDQPYMILMGLGEWFLLCICL